MKSVECFPDPHFFSNIYISCEERQNMKFNVNTRKTFFMLDDFYRSLPPSMIWRYVIQCCTLSHSLPALSFSFPHSSPIPETAVELGLWPVPKFLMVLELEKGQDAVLKSGVRDTAPCSKGLVRTDFPVEGSCCGPYLILWSLLSGKCLSSKRNISLQICCEVSRRMTNRSTPEEFVVGLFTNQRNGKFMGVSPRLISLVLFSCLCAHVKLDLADVKQCYPRQCLGLVWKMEHARDCSPKAVRIWSLSLEKKHSTEQHSQNQTESQNGRGWKGPLRVI